MTHQTTGADATPRTWLATRAYLNRHRYDLAQSAQDLYPSSWRVAGTPLLALPHWLPPVPIPLEQVRLSWRDTPPERPVTGSEIASEGVRPLRGDGTQFPSYAEALGTVARPGLFEDRSCYRLTDVDTAAVDTSAVDTSAAGASAAGAELTFCDGSYFEIIDICEATAHEYAAAVLAHPRRIGPPPDAELPLRSLVGDPTDLGRRTVIPAVCTLTLRADQVAGDAQMILHWRDPARVASGGGLYQVAPAGVFQPSSDASWNRANDFGLLRAITRELSEELLGSNENYGSDVQGIDYEQWPFYRDLEAARREGTLGFYWLGLGIDPLSLVADMLTVAVFDSVVFDRVFAQLVSSNEEGRIIRFPFNSETVERFTTTEEIQPAGAALLRTAWDAWPTMSP